MKLRTIEWQVPNSEELEYCAGVLEWQGNVSAIKHKTSPYMRLCMKSPYKDRLVAFQRACGGLGRISGPFAPTGHSVQAQYHLEFRGQELALIENMVGPRIRTRRRAMFNDARDHLRALRRQLNLKGSVYKIPGFRGGTTLRAA